MFALTKHVHSIKPPALHPAEETLSDLQEEEEDEDSASEPSYDPNHPSAGLDDPSDASYNPTPSCSTDTPVTLPADPPSPTVQESEFYFWPVDCEFYDDFVRY